ncbi:hypothetical protein EDD16DRAFT_2429 [Pisolithus croceorrhizus]|nr:hypothetical protein EDD16DRAFT_2429 [Pisolithus croceorrhizus]
MSQKDGGGIQAWTTSIRTAMANDPCRQLFEDQIQVHAFLFLEDYFESIISGPQQAEAQSSSLLRHLVERRRIFLGKLGQSLQTLSQFWSFNPTLVTTKAKIHHHLFLRKVMLTSFLLSLKMTSPRNAVIFVQRLHQRHPMVSDVWRRGRLSYLKLR